MRVARRLLFRHLAAIFGTYRWSICYFNAAAPLFFVNAVPLHGYKHGQWPARMGARGLVHRFSFELVMGRRERVSMVFSCQLVVL